MDIASYIANSQTTPASAELGTAQLQLVSLLVLVLVHIIPLDHNTIMVILL